MSILKPFRRTCRQFSDGAYSNTGRTGYVCHPKFASSPEHYIRAFLLIQKDLIELFDYIEPSFKNLDCYSYRVHEILMRVCIEVEANCKAILAENAYRRLGDWNMRDYKKLNATHHLASYQISFPLWHGDLSVRRPFSEWQSGTTLAWHDAYNATKHDRYKEFERANFRHLTDAVAGLVALLASQFHTFDFSKTDYLLAWGPSDGFEVALGNYFLVKFPDDWTAHEKYEFDWSTLSSDADPFQNLQF